MSLNYDPSNVDDYKGTVLNYVHEIFAHCAHNCSICNQTRCTSIHEENLALACNRIIGRIEKERIPDNYFDEMKILAKWIVRSDDIFFDNSAWTRIPTDNEMKISRTFHGMQNLLHYIMRNPSYIDNNNIDKSINNDRFYRLDPDINRPLFVSVMSQFSCRKNPDTHFKDNFCCKKTRQYHNYSNVDKCQDHIYFSQDENIQLIMRMRDHIWVGYSLWLINALYLFNKSVIRNLIRDCINAFEWNSFEKTLLSYSIVCSVNLLLEFMHRDDPETLDQRNAFISSKKTLEAILTETCNQPKYSINFERSDDFIQFKNRVRNYIRLE